MSGGSSECAARFKYARPLRRSFLALFDIFRRAQANSSWSRLYTDACTPCALCSEKSRRCSLPTLTSAHTPSVNTVVIRTQQLFYTKCLSPLIRRHEIRLASYLVEDYGVYKSASRWCVVPARGSARASAKAQPQGVRFLLWCRKGAHGFRQFDQAP